MATSARIPIRTRPGFINVQLLPVLTPGERSLVREWRLLLVNSFPLRRGHARYRPSQPELGFELCCALGLLRSSGHAWQPAVSLPERGTPQPAPRAASVRTRPC